MTPEYSIDTRTRIRYRHRLVSEYYHKVESFLFKVRLGAPNFRAAEMTDRDVEAGANKSESESRGSSRSNSWLQIAQSSAVVVSNPISLSQSLALTFHVQSPPF